MLGTNADFRTEMTVDAHVTGVRLTVLKPDTEYQVRVVAHRKNSRKTGESKPLGFKTIKGASSMRYDRFNIIEGGFDGSKSNGLKDVCFQLLTKHRWNSL